MKDPTVNLEEGKVLLVVTAYPNITIGKAEYDWEFPNNCDSSRMIGILELIKHDLLHSWNEKLEEEE